VQAPNDDGGDDSVDEPATGVSILVDFGPQAGLRDVTSKPAALAARSAAAVEAAMQSIHDLADRIAGAVDDLARRPDEVRVEFGVKLDAQAGALIARSTVEGHLVVTLRWAGDGGGDEDSGNP
jgi:hypothetical protein